MTWNQRIEMYKVGTSLGRSEVSPNFWGIKKTITRERLDVPLRYYACLNQRFGIYRVGVLLGRSEVN